MIDLILNSCLIKVILFHPSMQRTEILLSEYLGSFLYYIRIRTPEHTKSN